MVIDFTSSTAFDSGSTPRLRRCPAPERLGAVGVEDDADFGSLDAHQRGRQRHAARAEAQPSAAVFRTRTVASMGSPACGPALPPKRRSIKALARGMAEGDGHGSQMVATPTLRRRGPSGRAQDGVAGHAAARIVPYVGYHRRPGGIGGMGGQRPGDAILHTSIVSPREARRAPGRALRALHAFGLSWSVTTTMRVLHRQNVGCHEAIWMTRPVRNAFLPCTFDAVRRRNASASRLVGSTWIMRQSKVEMAGRISFRAAARPNPLHARRARRNCVCGNSRNAIMSSTAATRFGVRWLCGSSSAATTTPGVDDVAHPFQQVAPQSLQPCATMAP